eukprot:TRINITY_DN7514_c0_g1_i3.p1 TRINITY_DN7514_c0_g1~~TRINITY_DN7514_c0_g1_i3.p1  ORF type:complete len:2143 (+),score=500.59 TRINITY_DN7514_c0_g1_i3:93-6431(+)
MSTPPPVRSRQRRRPASRAAAAASSERALLSRTADAQPPLSPLPLRPRPSTRMAGSSSRRDSELQRTSPRFPSLDPFSVARAVAQKHPITLELAHEPLQLPPQQPGASPRRALRRSVAARGEPASDSGEDGIGVVDLTSCGLTAKVCLLLRGVLCAGQFDEGGEPVRLDLTGNSQLGDRAAPVLRDIVAANPVIEEVAMDGTRVGPAARALIESACDANKRRRKRREGRIQRKQRRWRRVQGSITRAGLANVMLQEMRRRYAINSEQRSAWTELQATRRGEAAAQRSREEAVRSRLRRRADRLLWEAAEQRGRSERVAQWSRGIMALGVTWQHGGRLQCELHEAARMREVRRLARDSWWDARMVERRREAQRQSERADLDHSEQQARVAVREEQALELEGVLAAGKASRNAATEAELARRAREDAEEWKRQQERMRKEQEEALNEAKRKADARKLEAQHKSQRERDINKENKMRANLLKEDERRRGLMLELRDIDYRVALAREHLLRVERQRTDCYRSAPAISLQHSPGPLWYILGSSGDLSLGLQLKRTFHTGDLEAAHRAVESARRALLQTLAAADSALRQRLYDAGMLIFPQLGDMMSFPHPSVRGKLLPSSAGSTRASNLQAAGSFANFSLAGPPPMQSTGTPSTLRPTGNTVSPLTVPAPSPLMGADGALPPTPTRDDPRTMGQRDIDQQRSYENALAAATANGGADALVWYDPGALNLSAVLRPADEVQAAMLAIVDGTLDLWIRGEHNEVDTLVGGLCELIAENRDSHLIRYRVPLGTDFSALAETVAAMCYRNDGDRGAHKRVEIGVACSLTCAALDTAKVLPNGSLADHEDPFTAACTITAEAELGIAVVPPFITIPEERKLVVYNEDTPPDQCAIFEDVQVTQMPVLQYVDGVQVPRPGGLLVEQDPSYVGCTLSVRITGNYTPDDQVVLRRRDDDDIALDKQGRLSMFVKGVAHHWGTLASGVLRTHQEVDSFEESPPKGSMSDGFTVELISTQCRAPLITKFLRRLRFCNMSRDPSAERRTVEVTLRMPQGECCTDTLSIDVISQDDPTELTVPHKRLFYRSPGGAAVPEHVRHWLRPSYMQLFPDVRVEDPDTDHFKGGDVTILLGAQQPGDSIFINPDPTGRLTVESGWCGTVVKYDGVTVGRLSLGLAGPPEALAVVSSAAAAVPQSPEFKVTAGSGRFMAALPGTPELIAMPTPGEQSLSVPGLNIDMSPEPTITLGPRQMSGGVGSVTVSSPTTIAASEASAPSISAPAAGADAGKKAGVTKVASAVQSLVPAANQRRKSFQRAIPQPRLRVNFSRDGSARIEMVQRLLRCICFTNTNYAAPEGWRTVELRIRLGPDGRSETEIVDDEFQLLKDRIEFRAVPALVDTPASAVRMSYREGSGEQRLAPFNLIADQQGFVEQGYGGGMLTAEFAEGGTAEDMLNLRTDGDLRVAIRKEQPFRVPDLDNFGEEFPWGVFRRPPPALGGNTPAATPADDEADHPFPPVQIPDRAAPETVPLPSPSSEISEAAGVPASTSVLLEAPGDSTRRSSAASANSRSSASRPPRLNLGKDTKDRMRDAAQQASKDRIAQKDKHAAGIMQAVRRTSADGLPGARQKTVGRDEFAAEALAADTEGRALFADVTHRDSKQPFAQLLVADDTLYLRFLPGATRKEALAALRALTFSNRSAAPDLSKRIIRVSLRDSGFMYSQTILEVVIQPVDNPTQVVLVDSRVRYRPWSLTAARLGAWVPCPMRRAILSDPDTEFIDGGTLTFDLTGGGQKGDHLGFLTQWQQELHIAAAQRYAAEMRALQEKGAEEVWGAPPWIGWVELQREAPEALTGRLIAHPGAAGGWEEEPFEIATLTAVTKGSQGSCSLRFTFANHTPNRITMPLASYALNCVTFYNVNDRLMAGQRVYAMKVVDAANTGEGRAKLFVECLKPMLTVPKAQQAPGPHMLAPQGSPKSTPQGDDAVLIKRAHAFAKGHVCPFQKILPSVDGGKPGAMLQRGYTQCRIAPGLYNPCEDDTVVLREQDNVAIKDGAVYVGSDYFGKVSVVLPTLVCIEHQWASKVTSKALASVCSAFALVPSAENREPRSVAVELVVCDGRDCPSCVTACVALS